MLVAHHIIDALRGIRHTATDMTGDPAYCQRIAKMIEGAAKFDFGELHLELKAKRESGPVYKLPEMTEDELGFWRDGLIPLPFGVCWFEFTLNGYRSGLLVREDGSRWFCQRIDWVRDEVMLDGIETVVDRGDVDDGAMNIKVAGNTKLYHDLHDSPGMGQQTAMSMASVPPMAIYFTLMLNSKTTEVVTVEAPAKLNRKRVQRGRTPLPAHRIVTIVPARFRGQPRGDGQPGGQKRLHWRRSHLRHYDHNTLRSKWAPSPLSCARRARAATGPAP